jgi:hypothetical protein
LQSATINELKRQLPAFLSVMAFELNIGALFAMKCLGFSNAELRNAVDRYSCKPVPLPVKNALELASPLKKTKRLPVFAPIGDEVGEFENNY